MTWKASLEDDYDQDAYSDDAVGNYCHFLSLSDSSHWGLSDDLAWTLVDDKILWAGACVDQKMKSCCLVDAKH